MGSPDRAAIVTARADYPLGEAALAAVQLAIGLRAEAVAALDALRLPLDPGGTLDAPVLTLDPSVALDARLLALNALDLPLGALRALDPLGLPLGALRALGALNAWTFRTLHAFSALRAFGALHTLLPLWALSALRLRPFGALGWCLRTFLTLRALRLLAAAFLNLGLLWLIAATTLLGRGRSRQRQAGDTGDQQYLAGHDDLQFLVFLFNTTIHIRGWSLCAA